MKTKRTLFSGLIVAAIFAAFGIFPEIQPVPAAPATPQIALLEPAATPTPCLDGLTCYHVRPSDTDGNDEGDDCPETGTASGIGCENRWGEDALNIHPGRVRPSDCPAHLRLNRLTVRLRRA